MEKDRSQKDLEDISLQVIEFLRPMHLRVFEIRYILKHVDKLLECVVLREM